MQIHGDPQGLLGFHIKRVELGHNRQVVLAGDGLPVGDDVVGLDVADQLIHRVIGPGDIVADLQQILLADETEQILFKSGHNLHSFLRLRAA